MSAFLVLNVNGKYFIEERKIRNYNEYITEKSRGEDIYLSKIMAECSANVLKSYSKSFYEEY